MKYGNTQKNDVPRFLPRGRFVSQPTRPMLPIAKHFRVQHTVITLYRMLELPKPAPIYSSIHKPEFKRLLTKCEWTN